MSFTTLPERMKCPKGSISATQEVLRKIEEHLTAELIGEELYVASECAEVAERFRYARSYETHQRFSHSSWKYDREVSRWGFETWCWFYRMVQWYRPALVEYAASLLERCRDEELVTKKMDALLVFVNHPVGVQQHYGESPPCEGRVVVREAVCLPAKPVQSPMVDEPAEDVTPQLRAVEEMDIPDELKQQQINWLRST